MSLKKKSLVFTEVGIPSPQVKNDKKLKIKQPVAKVENNVTWKTPTCFQSEFNDNKWISKGYNQSRGLSESINFGLVSIHWVIIAKQFLCILDQIQEHGKRKVNSYGTFSYNFSALVYLFKELDKLGISKLSDIKEDDFNKIYIAYAEGKTNATNLKNLKILSRLYEYGPHKYNLLSDGLSFDVNKNYLLLGVAKKSKVVGETDIISEDNALHLMSNAIDWVINRKDDLLDLIDISKLHMDVKNNGREGTLTVLQAKNLLHNNESVHAKLIKVRSSVGKNLVSFLQEGHRKPVDGVDDELGDFRKINLILKKFHQIYQAFSYVICSSFTGWRASEVFSINSGYLNSTAAGYYLNSNMIKTTMNKNELISRPIPDIVAQTILNLEEINNAIKGIFSHKMVNTNNQVNLLFKNVFGNPLDLKSMNEDLNIAWKAVSDNEHKFSTHQFRRFFAHFYIRRYKGTADAVRWNFRHISKDMILNYTRQAMNAKQLVESKKEFAKEIANSIVSDNQYTSIGVGNDLKKIPVKTLDLKAKVLTIEEASKYIEDKIESEFKDIHAMEWGYCMFQKGNSGAACEAKTGPIEARSEPSTCGRCKFLVTGSENINFWQHTVILHQDITENSFTTKIMKDESQKIIAIGTNILKRHEDKE